MVGGCPERRERGGKASRSRDFPQRASGRGRQKASHAHGGCGIARRGATPDGAARPSAVQPRPCHSEASPAERSAHGTHGLRQEAVHRRHPVDRGRRRRARLALPDRRSGDPAGRPAHRARHADGPVRRPGQGGRSLRAGPPRDPDTEPARAHRPAALGQAVRVAVQERGLLLLDAAAPEPDVGHGEPDRRARRRVRRGARARLRRLQLPHRRSGRVPPARVGHAGELSGGPISRASSAPPS